jgi:hypothetical protein
MEPSVFKDITHFAYELHISELAGICISKLKSNFLNFKVKEKKLYNRYVNNKNRTLLHL